MSDTLERLQKIKRLAEPDAVLWAMSFVGVCVLIGLDKIKPETLEYLLFAMVGRTVAKKAVEPEGK